MSGSSARIAMVTPYLPAPANTGGRIRMHRLARALCDAGAEVTLFACAGARETASLRAAPELEIYARVFTRNNDFASAAPWRAARRVRQSCPAQLARDLECEHAREPFDVLLCEHSYSTATTRRIAGVPLVVDEHNVESAYQAEFDAAGQRRGPAAHREVRRLVAWEHAVWKRATLVTCVSDGDARVVRERRSGPVVVVPNGADLDLVAFVPPSARAGANEVLFVGLLAHPPNVAAARFLAREVMPRVWRERPAARLVLCGRQPSRAVLALVGPRIVVTGTVASVAPYLARAGVYANALAQGAGSSLKVPEALAAGVPLVSTHVGVRGFPLVAGEDYARADDAVAFGREIVAALHAGASLDERARRARSVAEGYAWRAIGARFASAVLAVARGGAATLAP